MTYIIIENEDIEIRVNRNTRRNRRRNLGKHIEYKIEVNGWEIERQSGTNNKQNKRIKIVGV